MINEPFIFVLGPLLWISLGDIRNRTISHCACGALLVFWLLFSVIHFEVEQIFHHLFIGVVALMGGFLLYLLQVWGAGDGKLLAICLLWVGDEWPETLFSIAMLGGGLAGTYLLIRRFSGVSNNLPYGVAIAMGTLYQLSV